jgi:AcrR family transcriptional regulator
MAGDTYHHGDLRAAVLHEASELVLSGGVEALSLRELARRANVSHAAPAHHFGDKRGLLTALAAEGFDMLTRALDDAGGDFLEVAVAYIRFATQHPGHYAVMFLGDAVTADDPELVRARGEAEAVLLRGQASVEARGSAADREFAPLAAFALMHGLATLWNGHAISDRYKDTGAEELARHLGRLLFTPGAPDARQ